MDESERVAMAARLEGIKGAPMKYPSNVLEGFGTGALLDLRVRLAVDFLKSPMFTHTDRIHGPDAAHVLAVFALDVAAELLAVSESRGLVEPLPDDDGLNRQLRLQAARTARYSVWQQLAGARVAAEEQPRVGPAGPLAGRTFNG
jgi:hypothetical protein